MAVKKTTARWSCSSGAVVRPIWRESVRERHRSRECEREIEKGASMHTCLGACWWRRSGGGGAVVVVATGGGRFWPNEGGRRGLGWNSN